MATTAGELQVAVLLGGPQEVGPIAGLHAVMIAGEADSAWLNHGNSG